MTAGIPALLPHRTTENDMRTFTAALAVASLLAGSAAAMAQATRAPQANPFERQGTAATAPTIPSPQPAPRTASPQTGAAPTGANQFQSEGAAKQACGADAVVWANTAGSKAWHVSGDKYYGHTKRGAYMCQQAAQQAGYHPSGRAVRAQRAGNRTP